MAAIPPATVVVNDVFAGPLGDRDPEAGALVDAERLTKVLEHLTAHPEEWAQASWVRYYPGCGTTACLAGTTVVMAGYEIDWHRGHEKGTGGAVVASRTTDGQLIDQLAQELLGLDDFAALYLFFYYRDDIGELWRRAARVSDGRVAVPPEFVQ